MLVVDCFFNVFIFPKGASFGVSDLFFILFSNNCVNTNFKKLRFDVCSKNY